MLKTFLAAFAMMIVVAMSAPSDAAGPELNATPSDVMLHGYDPVAYFQDGPKRGDTRWTAEHDGGVYYFASAENRDAFSQNPERYAPEFGGYCSFGVRMGRKFDIDPTAYQILNDSLYVQLNHATRHRWLADVEENVAIAEGIWPQIAATPAEALR